MLRRKPAPVYDAAALAGLRQAGQFNARLMDFLRPHVREGVTTGELDQLAHDYIRNHGNVPACLGYQGYPRSICTSINDVVCHGIPGETVLHSGDIVNVDVTSIVDGWYGDSSEMFLIGEVSDEARQLCQDTHDAMYAGIRAIRPFGTVFDIGSAIFRFATARGYGVVRDYQGHGIGREFHQEPGVPHYPVRASHRDILRPGTCFTVEPMLNLGGWETLAPEADGWTVRTADGSLSAQFEHTVFVTEEGVEILTLTDDGPQEGSTI